MSADDEGAAEVRGGAVRVDDDGQARHVGPEAVGLVCPECGDDAVEEPPQTVAPYSAHGLDVPRYAHPDGEPLCPVLGPSGYQPAQPREVLADPLEDEIARRAQLARWHADDQGAGDGTEGGMDR